MVGALQSAAAELRGRVARAAEGPRKFLTVQVALSNRGGGVDLDPPVPVFQQAFTTLWKDVVGCVDALPRLCGMSPNLRAVADSCGGAEDGAKVGEVLAQDLPFQEATAEAWRELEAQVQEALALPRTSWLSLAAGIQSFADSWSSAAYLKKEHAFAGIERDIEQAQALQQSLSRCRVQRVFGSIFLDARTLRDRLAPVPEAALATMTQALAALARERCGEAFHRLDVCVKRLEEKPETSSGYAAYAEYYETAVREQASLEPVVRSCGTSTSCCGSWASGSPWRTGCRSRRPCAGRSSSRTARCSRPGSSWTGTRRCPARARRRPPRPRRPRRPTPPRRRLSRLLRSPSRRHCSKGPPGA
eukprot:SRR837773.6153.p1 GENE.SRR837773.6153~~SRR837773.6153.p1  ORF type:complete len:415 (-),score=53.95 SRR837773.6153:125-1204(-)